MVVFAVHLETQVEYSFVVSLETCDYLHIHCRSFGRGARCWSQGCGTCVADA
jgi:hypothetical protein